MYSEEELQALAKAQYEFKREYRFRNYKHTLFSLLSSAIILLIAVFIISGLIFDIRTVYGDGMETAVPDGHYIVSNRLAYQIRVPQRGDVVLSNGHLYRIIGMPGEEVSIYGGHLYINNTRVKEEYLAETLLTYPVSGKETQQVPEGSYYVLCDNRKCYDDSRQGFFITPANIQGRLLFVI